MWIAGRTPASAVTEDRRSHPCVFHPEFSDPDRSAKSTSSICKCAYPTRQKMRTVRLRWTCRLRPSPDSTAGAVCELQLRQRRHPPEHRVYRRRVPRRRSGVQLLRDAFRPGTARRSLPAGQHRACRLMVRGGEQPVPPLCLRPAYGDRLGNSGTVETSVQFQEFQMPRIKYTGSFGNQERKRGIRSRPASRVAASQRRGSPKCP